jgi:D-serine deaminase-like pyridoxal phosphate-dependent protein
MNANQFPWYTIANADEIETPALLVYADRVKHNIAEAIRMVGTPDRLRPHVKTHKSSLITQLQRDAGITQFKCATLAEARMLAKCGVPDILLAFPLFGPRIKGFLDLQAQYPNSQFSVILDAAEPAKQLSQAAIARHQQVNVYVDLDIGMGRTGAPLQQETLSLLKLCQNLAGLHLLGLHAYDGQVREPDADRLFAQCAQHYETFKAFVAQACTSLHVPKLQMIIGGSPSFPFYALQNEVQCSPGTYVLWDQGYAQDCPQQNFLTAALLLCRIISLPSPTTICVDLGHKAVGAENAMDKRVHFLNAPTLKALRQSEEHLVLEVPAGHSFTLGQVLYGVPYHVCPTVNLYQAYNVVEQGRVVDHWPIDARDRFAYSSEMIDE